MSRTNTVLLRSIIQAGRQRLSARREGKIGYDSNACERSTCGFTSILVDDFTFAVGVVDCIVGLLPMATGVQPSGVQGAAFRSAPQLGVDDPCPALPHPGRSWTAERSCWLRASTISAARSSRSSRNAKASLWSCSSMITNLVTHSYATCY